MPPTSCGFTRLCRAASLARMLAPRSTGQVVSSAERRAGAASCSSGPLLGAWCGRGRHRPYAERALGPAVAPACWPAARAASSAPLCAAAAQPAQAAGGGLRTSEPTALPPLPEYCTGCGVRLQAKDPERPGYFQVPARLLKPADAVEGGVDEAGGSGSAEADSRRAEEGATAAGQAGGGWARAVQGPRDSDAQEELGDDQFAGFSDRVDSWLDDEEEADEDSVAGLRIAEEADDGTARVLCARCYSLTHYGQIKSAMAEAALPDFDLAKRVGRKLALQRFRRSVVLCVIDAADFDGSLPRKALRALLPAVVRTCPDCTPSLLCVAPRVAVPDYCMGGQQRYLTVPASRYVAARQAQEQSDAPRLVMAVNKVDLLPSQATTLRVQAWARRRARQGGLPQPDRVALVSAASGMGVPGLLRALHEEVAGRGDVWVVGAQNAGKSSLINAMRRAVGKGDVKAELTTAALPGTTLGMLRVPGVMPPKCKMFDTPGVPHNFQLTSRLTADEVRMLLPRRRLRPRTYRLGEWQSVLVGGCARVDVVASPGATLYLTVWASDDIICHFGRTEGVDMRLEKHSGTTLVPPLGGMERLAALGPLQPCDVDVSGTSWKFSTVDVAIAGVAVTTREALLPDYARDLERPGFSTHGRKLPKAASRAEQRGKAAFT